MGGQWKAIYCTRKWSLKTTDGSFKKQHQRLRSCHEVLRDLNLQNQYGTFVASTVLFLKYNHTHTPIFLTSVFRQLPTIDLVLHYVGPVEGALVEVEVQGDGVPQAGHQHTELALVQVDATDLVPVGENDEGLERV